MQQHASIVLDARSLRVLPLRGARRPRVIRVREIHGHVAFAQSVHSTLALRESELLRVAASVLAREFGAVRNVDQLTYFPFFFFCVARGRYAWSFGRRE